MDNQSKSSSNGEMILAIQVSEEEKKHIQECLNEMHQSLAEALRDAYNGITTTSIVAKPLSPEDIARFKEAWEKAMNEPKSFETIRTEPAKLYPVEVEELAKSIDQLHTRARFMGEHKLLFSKDITK